MRDVELKYERIEKQAYDLVQELRDFRIYVLHSIVMDFVPINFVNTILAQPNTVGKRGRWISIILEFDLDIRPTKLVKG